MIEELKLITRTSSGRLIKVPAAIERRDGRIYFVKSPFSLKDEIKAMKGSKWHGFEEEGDGPYSGKKVWSVEDCQRNGFQLSLLCGDDVFEWFDRELVHHEYQRPLMPHQKDLTDAGLTYHYQLWAAEMGTGKTLSAQELIERSGVTDWFWIGPKTSLPNIQREFRKWKFPAEGFDIQYHTYEGLVRVIDEWPQGVPPPHGLICDESSRLKNATSQRSRAAQRLADMIREKWGLEHGFVIEMSGTPSPKTPIDWWSQCLSADTWVLTAAGPKQIAQLVGKSIQIYVRNQFCNTAGFYCTGEKMLYRLTTVEGFSIKATEDHRFMRVGTGWCELKDLNAGDQIELANQKAVEWLGEGSFGDGYLLGFSVGDGHIYLSNDGGQHTTLPVYGRKKALVPLLLSYLPDDYEPTGDEPKCIHHSYVSRLARKFGFTCEKIIPASFESTASSDCLRGFVRSLFDTDGSMDYNRLRITLSQKNKERPLAVQRILSYFGIRSTLQTKVSRKAKPSYIKGRKIKSPKIMYILHITGDDAERFASVIGFSHPDKSAKLAKRLAARHRHLTPTWVTVADVVEVGVEPTYDIEVPEQHCFTANGLLAHNCEIAWPGFLREGSAKAMEARMAFMVDQKFETAQFKKRIGWKDDESKCDQCGETREEGPHELDGLTDPAEYHPFKPSKNEVAYLYERLKGLVIIKHKKDCLNLPDKRYRQIVCKPNASTLRVAKALMEASPNAITGMTLLRELSDGFQYRETKDGMTKCHHCTDGMVEEWFIPGDEERVFSNIDLLDDELVSQLEKRKVTCPVCGGKQEVDKIIRITREVPCPKDAALRMLLDECEETGRIVVFAGFTGSVDRVVKLVKKEGWSAVRCDQGNFQILPHDNEEAVTEEPLDYWANVEAHPRVAFIANPESGGMSLTLVESRMAVYWSNSWKPEFRIQSEDRIHRKGMDENLGCTIVDLIHLPSDRRVLDVIRANRKLELMTMGEVFQGVNWDDAATQEGEFEEYRT